MQEHPEEYKQDVEKGKVKRAATLARKQEEKLRKAKEKENPSLKAQVEKVAAECHDVLLTPGTDPIGKFIKGDSPQDWVKPEKKTELPSESANEVTLKDVIGDDVEDNVGVEFGVGVDKEQEAVDFLQDMAKQLRSPGDKKKPAPKQPDPEEPTPTQTPEGLPVASLSTRNRGDVQFSYNLENVKLNPTEFLEAYIIYLKIRVLTHVEENDFSKAIKESFARLYVYLKENEPEGGYLSLHKKVKDIEKGDVVDVVVDDEDEDFSSFGELVANLSNHEEAPVAG